MTTIVLLALDNILFSGTQGIIDLFSLNALEDNKYKIILASPSGLDITDANGKRHSVDASIAEINNCDAIILPAVSCDKDGLYHDNILTDEVKQWLIQQKKVNGTLICAYFSGSLALAETGLLHNKYCSTHSGLYDELKSRCPTIKILPNSGIFDDQGLVTMGGILSCIYISLYLIDIFSGEKTLRFIYNSSAIKPYLSDAYPYFPQKSRGSENTFIEKLEYFIRSERYKKLKTNHIAKEFSISERTLNRRIKKITGETPKIFIDKVRIQHACELLKSSAVTTESISMQLGFSSAKLFRQTFKKFTGYSPTGYKKSVIQEKNQTSQNEYINSY